MRWDLTRDSDSRAWWAEWGQFSIGSEADGYRLYLAGAHFMSSLIHTSLLSTDNQPLVRLLCVIIQVTEVPRHTHLPMSTADGNGRPVMWIMMRGVAGVAHASTSVAGGTSSARSTISTTASGLPSTFLGKTTTTSMNVLLRMYSNASLDNTLLS